MRKLDCQEQWGAERLEAQLEIARDGLRGLDRSIRKILGRDLPDGESGPLQSRIPQKRLLQEDRRRVITEFANNELSGGKRRWQVSNVEPKTVFSRLSARVPSTADDSADEDDSITKVKESLDYTAVRNYGSEVDYSVVTLAKIIFVFSLMCFTYP